ncbi:D-2-hydroxyacid dehydrogenase [Cohnella nanjingensis]|uniref:D-2-hydroxyacid dehydrogenase n=1 Tax=Cohnella nanjingensis TaxID=1387779 RepID=A0A7X0RWD9_9BACL|nr:D-2-hydroxyacid dehydrogenase [Cohnella nanjingensis]MBB6674856.1 D-2-hydroxyacid dehydrogenase [Cohnella nanjingensis]
MNIVVLDGHTLNPGDLSWERLEALGPLTVYDRTPAERIVERAEGAEIVLTNKTPLRADVLDRLPKLRYIGVLATGYDIVDVQAAADRDIVVANVPTYGTDSVAQFVFALLLELCHRAGLHSDSAHRGDWADSPDFSYWHTPQTELAGKTLGIVGMGRIGARTAELAAAFGMRVLAAGRSVEPQPGDPANVRRADLATVLKTADVVSLHCPLTPQTERMINRDTLALMKPSAYLINTARGKLVAEDDLAGALRSGAIAGAALDVLSQEPPPPDHPLVGAPNCILTPHIAWASFEARERLLRAAVDNVARFLAGDPANLVSR